MSHEVSPRLSDRSPLRLLRGWFRRRAPDAVDPNAPAPRETVMTGAGPLRPFEDESSGDFTERVARIEADARCRALAVAAAKQRAVAARQQAAAAPPSTAARATTSLADLKEERHPWAVD